MRPTARKLVKRQFLKYDNNAFEVARPEIRMSHATLKMLQPLNQWSYLYQLIFVLHLAQHFYIAIEMRVIH